MYVWVGSHTSARSVLFFVSLFGFGCACCAYVYTGSSLLRVVHTVSLERVHGCVLATIIMCISVSLSLASPCALFVTRLLRHDSLSPERKCHVFPLGRL